MAHALSNNTTHAAQVPQSTFNPPLERAAPHSLAYVSAQQKTFELLNKYRGGELQPEQHTRGAQRPVIDIRDYVRHGSGIKVV